MHHTYMSKVYLRDGRAPLPRTEAISRVMSANKDKETKPEIQLRKALWNAGIRGYRKNWKQAKGRPDIAFPGRKIAIFVHGCFWHNCEKCRLPTPKTNAAFWKEKFERNRKRDNDNVQLLITLGWSVLVVRECDLKADVNQVVKRVSKMLDDNLAE